METKSVTVGKNREQKEQEEKTYDQVTKGLERTLTEGLNNFCL
jgi:hypothetical protein